MTMPKLEKTEKTMPPTDEQKESSSALGNIKLSGNAKDTEMMKPADISDPDQKDNSMSDEHENVQESIPPNQIDSKKKSME